MIAPEKTVARLTGFNSGKSSSNPHLCAGFLCQAKPPGQSHCINCQHEASTRGNCLTVLLLLLDTLCHRACV